MVEVDVVEYFTEGYFQTSFGLAFRDQEAIVEEEELGIFVRLYKNQNSLGTYF